jgi:hypothetical protein
MKRSILAAVTIALGSSPALAQAPAPPPAGSIAALDGDKDGIISPDEWTRGGLPPALFARADADGDGKVSQQEVRSVLDRGGRGGGGPGRFAARTAAADLDKDGGVTEEEWTKANLPANLFAVTDADKNGSASQQEIAAALAARRGRGPWAAPNLAALDLDKSGGISREEWAKGGLPENRFVSADADKDNQVSESEAAAMVAQWRGGERRGSRRGDRNGGPGSGYGSGDQGEGGFDPGADQ